jgi:hypothetical protein
MITDERVQRKLPPLRRIAGAVALVVCGWLAVVVALTFGSAPGKSMAIIGPQAQALAAVIKANGRILAANDYVTIARSDEDGFVARLYAAGALLVLDAEQAGGCSGLAPAATTPSYARSVATKQSIFRLERSGLLRFARNDEEETLSA